VILGSGCIWYAKTVIKAMEDALQTSIIVNTLSSKPLNVCHSITGMSRRFFQGPIKVTAKTQCMKQNLAKDMPFLLRLSIIVALDAFQKFDGTSFSLLRRIVKNSIGQNFHFNGCI
jgi:hypothetical protein